MNIAAIAVSEVTSNTPDDMRELVARFQRAQMSLANDFGRVVTDVAAHPRHNQHVGDLEIVVQLLEQVAGCARVAAKRVY